MTNNKSQKTILVVDDDPDYSELTRMRLESAGYEVSCAPNGDAALKLLDKNCEPDLIIMDVEMPTKNGLTTLINLNIKKKLHPDRQADVPVIVATGLTSETVKNLMMGQNIGGYLTKPYNADELLEKVNRLIGSR